MLENDDWLGCFFLETYNLFLKYIPLFKHFYFLLKKYFQTETVLNKRFGKLTNNDLFTL